MFFSFNKNKSYCLKLTFLSLSLLLCSPTPPLLLLFLTLFLLYTPLHLNVFGSSASPTNCVKVCISVVSFTQCVKKRECCGVIPPLRSTWNLRRRRGGLCCSALSQQRRYSHKQIDVGRDSGHTRHVRCCHDTSDPEHQHAIWNHTFGISIMTLINVTHLTKYCWVSLAK